MHLNITYKYTYIYTHITWTIHHMYILYIHIHNISIRIHICMVIMCIYAERGRERDTHIIFTFCVYIPNTYTLVVDDKIMYVYISLYIHCRHIMSPDMCCTIICICSYIYIYIYIHSHIYIYICSYNPLQIVLYSFLHNFISTYHNSSYTHMRFPLTSITSVST